MSERVDGIVGQAAPLVDELPVVVEAALIRRAGLVIKQADPIGLTNFATAVVLIRGSESKTHLRAVVLLPRLLRKSNFDCQLSSPARHQCPWGARRPPLFYSGVNIIG
jgi:hypothetical protein